VIHERIGITGLAFAAPYVLFDLFETGFNFSPCLTAGRLAPQYSMICAVVK